MASCGNSRALSCKQRCVPCGWTRPHIQNAPSLRLEITLTSFPSDVRVIDRACWNWDLFFFLTSLFYWAAMLIDDVRVSDLAPWMETAESKQPNVFYSPPHSAYYNQIWNTSPFPIHVAFELKSQLNIVKLTGNLFFIHVTQWISQESVTLLVGGGCTEEHDLFYFLIWNSHLSSGRSPAQYGLYITK